MVYYIIRRLIAAVIMLIVIAAATFVMFFLAPNDPARLACGRTCSLVQIDAVNHYLGYDKPVSTQFGQFMEGLVHERTFPDDPAFVKAHPSSAVRCSAPCLGYSNVQTELVSGYIKDRWPVSVSIALGAFVLWITFGVGLGIIAALRRGRVTDRLLVSLSLVVYSFPTFFLGLLIYQYLNINNHILPSPNYTSLFSNPISWAGGLLMAWITLAAVYIAGYIRLTRAYMLETMGEDYLRTARAKGVSKRTIVFKHTLRAALTPVVTAAGLDLGVVLAGTVIMEQVFNLPGLGQATVSAVQNNDLSVIVAIVLVSAVAIVLANLVVDVLYGLIDPRVRFD